MRSVPTGTEKGTFLAVDLGGSNCRICLVKLHGDSTFTVTQSRHKVPSEVMVCQSYKPLFSFIAEKIADFLAAHLTSDAKGRTRTNESGLTPYRLGFTFSFTCEQTSLAGGKLVHWDKGWDIPEALGKDPCVMLQEAIDKLKLPVLVTVLANDSVGTLLTRSYTAGQDTSTLAAIIFGTGTNAAYVEKISNINRLGTTVAGHVSDIMVINTEWGCLDDKMEVLPRTSFDDEIDEASTDRGCQMLEKRVSGMYLGEILRLAVLKLVRHGDLEMTFDKESPLFRKHGIDTSFLSELAIASSKDLSQTVAIIRKSLLAEDVTVVNVKAIQLLSTAIVRRAARLAGASLAAIVIQSGRLRLPHEELKHPDSRITEYHTAEIPFTPMNSIGRFRHNLSLLWRRISRFFLRLNFPTKRSIFSTSTQPKETFQRNSMIDIGADGSLIELYPTFEADMRAAMREVKEIGTDGEQSVRIRLAKDGSGVGAALMAQAALETEKIAEN